MSLMKEQIRWLYARLTVQQLQNAKVILGDVSTLVGAKPYQLAKIGLSKSQVERLQSPWPDELEKTMVWLEENRDCVVIDGLSSDYPSLLLEVSDAPAVLLAKGDVSLLSKPQIAIVGSRKPTQQGRDIAHHFAKSLAALGFVICSGMALGVDAAAHRGALAAKAKTIAVVGTGLARVYPRQHHQLMDDIIKQGVVISELPPFSAAKAEHFPQRNRLISGLSLGVLVIEAARRSGSLSTAHHAARQGREVFAVPGSIYNALSKGCHYLIKQGAKLVEQIQDIMDELGHYSVTVADRAPTADLPTHSEKNRNSLDKEHLNLLDCVDDSHTSVDIITKRSGLTVGDVMAKLLTLEVAGFVTKNVGGFQKNS